jgi:two-component system sensor histidine kinase BarA
MIAVSAYISEQEEEILKATGINDFLIKPVKRADIHRSLLKWIPAKENVTTEENSKNHNKSDNNTSQFLSLSNSGSVEQPRRSSMHRQNESDFSELKIIDWNAAVEAANKNAIIAKEILGMLIESLPEFTNLIRSSFAANDYKTLTDQVHKLHGSASYCGVPRLKQAAYTCEKILKSNDHQHLGSAVDALIKAINEVMQVAPDYV